VTSKEPLQPSPDFSVQARRFPRGGMG
jgi:hypothetical protein